MSLFQFAYVAQHVNGNLYRKHKNKLYDCSKLLSQDVSEIIIPFHIVSGYNNTSGFYGDGKLTTKYIQPTGLSGTFHREESLSYLINRLIFPRELMIGRSLWSVVRLKVINSHKIPCFAKIRMSPKTFHQPF